jgi:hypothetical protein
MGATLDALHRLQLIESDLRAVRDQMESKQRRVRVQRQKVAKLEHQIAETKHAIQHAQSESDRLELDRKQHEEHITKLRQTLNEAKNNKEYAAVLTQLNTDKADAMKLEDAVLAGLGKVDELKKELADFQEQHTKEQGRFEAIEKKVTDESAELVARQKDLEAKREDAAENIPPQVLSMFEKACERHEGEAMALVDRVSPRRNEYICGGCNMSVPLEVINALQSRDEVQRCQNCQRILCLEIPKGVPV